MEDPAQDIDRQIEGELEYVQKSAVIAFTLWLGLLGLGAHRIYLNRVWSGIFQIGLFVLGLGAAMAVAASYFVMASYGETEVVWPTALTLAAGASVLLLGTWLIWALVDGFCLTRWIREDTEEKRAELEQRYRA
ncbi:MAG: NINE protein [Pseudomonadota bacterium]